jgi:hypothetical protein
MTFDNCGNLLSGGGDEVRECMDARTADLRRLFYRGGAGAYDPPMDGGAIFGFAGVLVGAASTYLIQRGSEGRRERGDARVGIRLVKKDLVAARETIEIGLEVGRWWQSLDFEISLGNWERYAGDLARALPLDEWEELRETIAVTESVEDRAAYIEKIGRDPEMTEDDREVVTDILGNVVDGEQLADRLALRLQTRREKVRAWWARASRPKA